MARKRKRQMYIKGGIVFDPNIPKPTFLDYDYEDIMANRKIYLKAKGKRKKYFGI